MDNKKLFIKNNIEELTNRYKTVATLSLVPIVHKDFVLIKKLHTELHEIYDELINIVAKLCTKEELKAVKEFDVKTLPDYLQPIKIIKEYQEILALHYAYTKLKNQFDYLRINKMSIEFNPNEELAYYNIMVTLIKNKKYAEAIKIGEYVAEFSSSSTVWDFLGAIYYKLKKYGKALEAYNNYLKLNNDDSDILNKIKKIYKELLK